MKNNCIAVFLLCFAFASCSTLKRGDFSSNTPVLDPVKFFGGHTQSNGLPEAHSGGLPPRVTTKTNGVYANGILTLNQDIFEEEKNQTTALLC